jgi:hypothetical protein
MFIQNCAASDIQSGLFYKDPGTNSMLISIADPGSWRPEAMPYFAERHDFEFLDIEKEDTVFDEECRVSDAQAAEIVRLLQHAIANDMNVIVHCFAGVCRSGAVAEVGVMMGFEDTGAFRSPNLLVKHKMMKVLGVAHDENEGHTINGVAFAEDWINDNEKVFMLADARRQRTEVLEKFPDITVFDLVQDGSSGIGAITTMRFYQTVNDMNGSFDVEISGVEDW